MVRFSRNVQCLFPGIVLTAVMATILGAQAAVSNAGGPERVDYLTFAQGAVPVRIGGAGAKFVEDFEAAVRITDGDPTAFIIVNRATADTDTEFVYQLHALTTFDRFAVPNIGETPSPATTFTKVVEVHGSAASATEGFRLLASATLETHRARGLVTDLPVTVKYPVRWVKVRLRGAINIPQPASFFKFSEIVGNGAQDAPPLATGFNGVGLRQANRIRLAQNGSAVSGCYDGRRPERHSERQHPPRDGRRSAG